MKVLLFALALTVGIVVVLAVVIRTALTRLGRAVREAMAQVAMAAPPPPRTHLYRQAGIAWPHEAEVLKARDDLVALGFADAGQYEPDGIPCVQLWAFAKPEDRIYAVVYDHNRQGVWVDMMVLYDDDTGLTVSNAPLGGELDRPPWRDGATAPGADVPALWQMLTEALKDKPRQPAPADGFAAVFEAAYARTMDWRNLRGGCTEEEVRRTAAVAGMSPSDEAVARTVRRGNEYAAAGVSVLLQERFLAATPLPSEHVRRLLIVHDRLSRWQLVEHMAQALDEADVSALYVDEDDVDVEELLQERVGRIPEEVASTREVFRQLNADLPARVAFEAIGSVDEPVPADVYLAPTSEEEAQEEQDEGASE